MENPPAECFLRPIPSKKGILPRLSVGTFANAAPENGAAAPGQGSGCAKNIEAEKRGYGVFAWWLLHCEIAKE
jgi:hypothetical protein